MPFVLGIDVGTTYTAAALSRDGRAEVIGLESHRVTVPSVVFADGDNVVYGTAAESRGATNPAGMAREFKRRLGDPVPIVLSGSPYSADRLVALFVRWVVDSVTAQIGEAPARVVVTHPANWTEFQLHLLSTALEQVDLGGGGAAVRTPGRGARLRGGRPPRQLVIEFSSTTSVAARSTSPCCSAMNGVSPTSEHRRESSASEESISTRRSSSASWRRSRPR